jgi:hypothetical protein
MSAYGASWRRVTAPGALHTRAAGSNYTHKTTHGSEATTPHSVIHYQYYCMAREGYGLTTHGFETQQTQEKFLLSKTPTSALGPTQDPLKRLPGIFPRGKAAGM